MAVAARHGAGRGDAEIGDGPFGPVFADDHGAVPGADAEGREQGSETAGSGSERGVGEARHDSTVLD